MLNPKSQIPNPKHPPYALASGIVLRSLGEGEQIPISNFQNAKQRNFGHWVFGHWLFFVIWCLVFGILISGCTTIKEATKGIAGVSTKVLEDSKKDTISKTFNYDINSCYNKVKEILKKMDSYVYAEDLKKHMIAVYVSEGDTTPVGIFFKEIDANNTQIEVSSPSTFAKEFIAKDLFSVLDKTLSIEELEAQIHAKKEMENK